MEKISPDGEVPKSVSVILNNRQKLAERIGVERVDYTPPAEKHYHDLYFWDSCAAAYILAHHGYAREAETEILSILNGQRTNGMIPNVQRYTSFRRWDPENLTFTEPGKGSDYGQPLLLPTAIAETYQAIAQEDKDRALLFLESTYQPTEMAFKYFGHNRQLGDKNPLVFNTHPHETGRDSDPSLNGYKPKLPRTGENTSRALDIINAGLDYTGTLALGGLNRLNGWDPQKIRRYYQAVDPMFNSIYVSNMRHMEHIAGLLDKKTDAEYWRNKADEVEQKIMEELWITEARQGRGAFMVQNTRGPKKDISIGSLGPVLLTGLKEYQLESTLDLLDSSFNTPFSLPSVATDSPHYDPEGQQFQRIWVGEVWMITNWLVAKGLRAQAERVDLAHRPDLAERCLYWANDRIVPSSQAMLEQGYYEKYSPNTGRPQRKRTVESFVWNGLIETL